MGSVFRILPQQEQFARVVSEVQDYGIFMLDSEGRVMSWNTGAERIKGYRRDEIIGQHFSIFYPAEAIKRGWPEYELKVAAEQGSFEDEGWRLRKDGTRFWANVVITPWREQDGELHGFLKITRDLTLRKHAEEQAADFALRLQSSNRELEEFASVAAHDLQEPLRKIEAFSDRLQARAQNLDDQSTDYLRRIVYSTKRMRDLINDLLSYSRISSKAQEFVEVNLTDITRTITSDLEELIQQTGGRVEAGLLPTIEADPLQMRQLMMNLVGNALKFRRREDAPVVQISATEESHSVTINIADNGIGFEEIYLDRIFDLFQRLHGRHEYEGTGLGLAICRKIVERHGGKITASSKPGAGSTFIVTLPRQHRRKQEKLK